ncbi:MAG: hypothetical protein NVS2B8_06170 [Vulcanimicrobiaceae bacterium]
MLATMTSADRTSPSAITSSQDLVSSPEAAFALICEVEKWPVWLSFLTSARRLDDRPLRLGSEIALRGAIPGDPEELYEVDRYLDGHIVSLVGAYSVRRRIVIRIERKGQRAKAVVHVDYPAYGGVIGAIFDRMTARRRLEGALDESLLHFKSLVEFRDVDKDQLLADF